MKFIALMGLGFCFAFNADCQQRFKTFEEQKLHRFLWQYQSGISANGNPVIASDYYARHLGFFCKQELKLQQAHVPVTFRLGSMEYVNRLEQKPGYR